MLFGQVVLLIGLTLAAEDALDHLRDNWLDIPRFILAGAAVAVFTATLPLAVSAFTTRRAYAAAFVIGVFIISAIVGGALSECDEEQRQSSPRGGEIRIETRCEPATGDAAKWFALISIPQVPMHVNDLIFDVEEEDRTNMVVSDLPDVVPVGWYLLLTAGMGFALWWRYREDKGMRPTRGSSQATATEPTIKVQGVSKWFGSVVAVNDISVQVHPGITGLLGPNGAGKNHPIAHDRRPGGALGGGCETAR